MTSSQIIRRPTLIRQFALCISPDESGKSNPPFFTGNVYRWSFRFRRYSDRSIAIQVSLEDFTDGIRIQIISGQKFFTQ